MKRKLILLVVLGLIACEHNNLLVPTDIGRDLYASAGDAVLVRDFQIKSPFSVQVLEILDSRCPIGAVCLAIWAGYTSVKFEIESNTFTLKIGESKEFSAEGKNFRITLKDVVPYPSLEKTYVEKQAVFVIQRI